MTQRNSQLDLLRGIAVLMVMLYHYPYFSTFRIGWAGVDLFFVLSGFLISGLLFTDWKQNRVISLKRFFVRRGFKIYPSFYFLLLTTAPLLLTTRPDHKLMRLASEVFFLQDYVPNFWAHTWSLAIEEQFYIVLPLLLLLVAKFHSPRRPFAVIPLISLVLIAVCLALRLASHPATTDIRRALHFRADALFAGVALGYLFHFRETTFRALSRWWLLPLGLGALMPLCLYGETSSQTAYVLTCNTVGFVCLVWWIIPRSNIRAPWIERVGVYSYSVYLWHVPILHAFDGRGLHLPLLLLYLAISIAAGMYLGKIVEFRALTLRDKFLDAVSRYPLPTSASTNRSGNRDAESLVRVEVCVDAQGEG